MAFASDLNRFGRIYVRIVSLLGLVVAGESLVQLLRSPLQPQWILLAFLTLISGSAWVRLPWAHVSISISEAFVFTAVLLYGPSAGTITVVLDCLIISFWIARRRPEFDRALFNAAAPALSIWCSAHLFFYVAAVPPLAEQASASNPATTLTTIFPPLVLFAVSYFTINSWLVTVVIAIEKAERAWHVWRENFVWLSLNYFFGASVAAFLVSYNRTIDLRFVAVIVPLLLVLYFAFRTSTQRVADANKHVDQLNALYLSTIETLAMAIDAKDQVTHGHIRRVQAQAVRLATAIGIKDKALIKAIEAAALLHDMGKLAVPEHILNKPGKLTETEFERMKLHASIGADILSAIDFPYPVVPIVRHHHENWDGTGYPSGLKGTDIPIGARILSVVDCFDALTSDRPYRRQLSDDQAVDILRQRRGSMYDPLVVDTFIRVNTGVMDQIERKGPGSEVLRAIANSHGSAASPPKDDGYGADDTEYDRIAAVMASNTFDDHPHITSALRALVPFEICVFYVYDASNDELQVHQVFGERRESVGELRIPLGQKLSGWVGANRVTVRNSDPMLDLADLASLVHLGSGSCLSCPIVVRGDLVGVLSFYSPQTNFFSPEHQRRTERLALSIEERRLRPQDSLSDRPAAIAP